MGETMEILTQGTRVYCSPDHRFGTDALLLARFCPPHRNQRAVDLCSGCGIVSLEWHDGGHRGPCQAVEIAPEASALLTRAVEDGGYDHITPVLADLCSWTPPDAGLYDVVACNPPYFVAGPESGNAARATARHELACSLEDVCRCGARLLRDGGRFALCQRPQRLAEVFAALQAARLEPKRLAFVKNKSGGVPWLFLVEAQKNRRPGLIVEPDVLISAGAALYGPAAQNK